MVKRHFFVVASLSCLASGALADNYQYELTGEYANTERGPSESDAGALVGRYYFSPVDTENRPLAEAAFLNRASGISLAYQRTERDFFFPATTGDYAQPAVEASTRSDSGSLALDYYVPNTILYLGLTVSHVDYEDSMQYSGSDTTYGGTLGITPMDGLLISSDFHEDQDIDEEWNLNARYVTEVFGSSIAIEADYRYYDHVERVDYAGVRFDYYFDNTFSVGVSHDEAISTGAEDGVTSVMARKFFTNRVSLQASYLIDSDIDSFNLGMSVRF